MGYIHAATRTCGLLLVFTASLASAQVTEYTDQTAFDAAAANVSSFGFESVAPPGFLGFGGVSVGGIDFAGSATNIPIAIGTGAEPVYGGAAFFTSVSQNPGIDSAEVVCTLSGSNAIGFTYGDVADAGAQPFTVSLSTGDGFSLLTPPTGQDTGFVGFTSTAPITSIVFSDNGQEFDVIQFETSSPGAVGVPEPGPLVLLATGLLALTLVPRSLKARVARASW
jgi:hypothetical protein